MDKEEVWAIGVGSWGELERGIGVGKRELALLELGLGQRTRG